MSKKDCVDCQKLSPISVLMEKVEQVTKCYDQMNKIFCEHEQAFDEFEKRFSALENDIKEQNKYLEIMKKSFEVQTNQIMCCLTKVGEIFEAEKQEAKKQDDSKILTEEDEKLL